MKPHPAAALFPEMIGQDFEALVADIRAHGLRAAITVHDGMILDGRNRWRACRRLGIEPQTVEWDGEATLEAFVVSMNLSRRHLNESQRALIAAKLAKLAHGTNRFQRLTVEGQICPSTIQQSADLLNVARGSVVAAKKILAEGAPTEILAIERGDAAVTTIARAIARGATPEQRRLLVSGFKDARGRRLPERPLAECVTRTIDQLDNAAELLGTLLLRTDAERHTDRPLWIARLRRLRAAISRLIHLPRMEKSA